MEIIYQINNQEINDIESNNLYHIQKGIKYQIDDLLLPYKEFLSNEPGCMKIIFDNIHSKTPYVKYDQVDNDVMLKLSSLLTKWNLKKL